MKNKERCLMVVSGPSGAGKDTVVQMLRAQHPEIAASVSATTRAPRAGEVHGVHYYFVTRDAFETMLHKGEILEHTQYCGNYYGTPRSEVRIRMDAGVTVVLVIEVEGAANFKIQYPECTTVFIRPPSMDELEARLRGRGTETDESIEKRMNTAKKEMELATQYDFCIVNDTVERCAQHLYEILQERQG